eukprot:1158194-Pelagomonas_calceolata.AAC.3
MDKMINWHAARSAGTPTRDVRRHSAIARTPTLLAGARVMSSFLRPSGIFLALAGPLMDCAHAQKVLPRCVCVSMA